MSDQPISATVHCNIKKLPFSQRQIQMTITAVSGLPDPYLFLYSPHIIKKTLIFQRVIRPDEFNLFPPEPDDSTPVLASNYVRKRVLHYTVVNMTPQEFISIIKSGINELIRQWRQQASFTEEMHMVIQE